METMGPLGICLLVTLDTGVLDEMYSKVERAARTLPMAVEFATISVSDRERGEHETKPKNIPTIPETAVIGESSWGEAVLGSENGSRVYEHIRAIISSGSYKPPDGDKHPHDGQWRQVRDAMALSDHVRERRDIFITTDARAFINHGRREQLEALCRTRIMTPAEFIEFCTARGEAG